MLAHLSMYIGFSGISSNNVAMNFLAFFNKGGLGVDIFFVISGFLIGRIIFIEAQKSQSISFKKFYFKRFLRLTPAYYATLILLICLPEKTLLSNSSSTFIWNFLYVSNFITLPQQFMAWSWSLAIEEQFYLLFPLFVLIVYRLKLPLFQSIMVLYLSSYVTLYAIVIFQNIANPSHETSLDAIIPYWDYVYSNTLIRLGSISAGVLVAYYFVHCKKVISQLYGNKLFYLSMSLFAWLSFFAACWFIFPIRGVTFDEIMASSPFLWMAKNTLFSTFVAIFILHCHFSNNIIKTACSSIIWYPTAQLSYSLYLLHPIAYVFSIELFVFLELPHSNINIILLAIFSILISYLSAFILYLFVERPFILLRDNITNKRPLFKR